MAGVDEFIFCARKVNETDGHWYANIGYYAHDPDRKAWREGAKLYRWNLATGKLTTLLDDPRGGVRDPQVHYDGTEDPLQLPQGRHRAISPLTRSTPTAPACASSPTAPTTTSSPPTCPTATSSSSPPAASAGSTAGSPRWPCCTAATPTAGTSAPISSNNEQDNTPGRCPTAASSTRAGNTWIAARSITTISGPPIPTAPRQMIWYGNLHPGIVMIDAKPIPGSDKVVAIFSPGHGQREHAGAITVVDPKAGPDAQSFARPISQRQPLPRSLGLLGGLLHGRARARRSWSWTAPARSRRSSSCPTPTCNAGLQLHEPRPLMPRPRERIIPDRVDPDAATGRLVLADIYDGRNMAGVKRGEIKKLLVLETLPMPIHYTGGMEPISYGGTFTLERIVGTVPVEADGSAYFELPALRSFFFVALDENDLSVKRMQSFLTVQPGETTSCVGCHEQRTQTPRARRACQLAGRCAAPPSRDRAHRRRARGDRFPARHPADPRRALRELPRLREDRRRRPARRAR